MLNTDYTQSTFRLLEKPTSEEEMKSPKASYQFDATTTLAEKIGRVFNAAMFITLGAQIGCLFSGVSMSSGLASAGISLLAGSLLLQSAVVLATITVAAKILVFVPLFLVVRKILAVAIISQAVYPAASNPYKYDDERGLLSEHFAKKGYELRRVTLNKSGIDYDAFLVSPKNAIHNGKWVQIAGGNEYVGETALAYDFADKFLRYGVNVLYINGPGVARSSGYPTSYSIGAGQEAGLQFLEKEIKAKKIFMYGLSLGGGAKSEAILGHDFSYAKENKINYMVWSDRTFDLLSNAAAAMVAPLASFIKPIFSVLGIELNNVAAAQKLKELNIPHIVTQNNEAPNKNPGCLPNDGEVFLEDGTDGVIPNKSSYYVGLRKNNIVDAERIKFYGSANVGHIDSLPFKVNQLVNSDIVNFFK